MSVMSRQLVLELLIKVKTLQAPLTGGVAHPNSLDEDRSNVTTNGQVSQSVSSTSDVGPQYDTQAQTPPNAPPIADSEGTGNLGEAPQLSKSQLKKLKRKQEWEAGRETRKVKRKEKMQEKKQRKRATQDNIDSTVETPGLDGDGKPEKRPESAKKPRFRSTQLPITFILDCAFNDLMLDKERMSLAAQVTRCYSDNYKSPYKAHLTISSFGGHLKERFDNVLEGHHNSWKGVRFFSRRFCGSSCTIERMDARTTRRYSCRCIRSAGHWCIAFADRCPCYPNHLPRSGRDYLSHKRQPAHSDIPQTLQHVYHRWSGRP